MPRIRVGQGDSVSSIARTHGFFWKAVWDHAENADLKEERGDPNVLEPGDMLFVPERTLREEDAATDQQHKYVLKGIPEMLRLQVLYEGEPQASKVYTLEVEDTTFEGTTDGEGRLEHPISPDARKGRLVVEMEDEDDPLIINLHLGHLDPAKRIQGVEHRLRNLGYEPGESAAASDAEQELDPITRDALLAFQHAQGLELSGEPDDPTAQKLQELHES